MLFTAGRVHLNKENWVAKGTAIILKGRHVVLQSGSLHSIACYYLHLVYQIACIAPLSCSNDESLPLPDSMALC